MGPHASGGSGRRRRIPASDLSWLVDGGRVDRGPDYVRGLVDNRLYFRRHLAELPQRPGFVDSRIPSTIWGLRHFTRPFLPSPRPVEGTGPWGDQCPTERDST